MEQQAHLLALPAPDFTPIIQQPRPLAYCNDDQMNKDENGHFYVGLVNQAMTCYLNSLVQTLYMTPEFRNAIYTWRHNGRPEEESKNIPYQLQKLFLLLQTSEKSVETHDLTASFGWETHDAYEQHDVQELCRLMFDALEHRWRDTDHANLVADLYKGTMEDCVKCLKCQTENVRPDIFFDLPLAVKQYGNDEAFKSIEEALRAFSKLEVLEGQNKYFCENCESLQDAEKSLRVTHFPYILSIQLKRFDYDYRTLNRIKLNDRMTFPDYLDLNDFVHSPKKEKLKNETEELPKASGLPMSYASVAAKPAPSTQTPDAAGKSKEVDESDEAGVSSTTNKTDDENDDSGWMKKSRNSEEVKELLKRGKYIYELFSIMVHQGSASGGHYYAYIKNLEQDQWFCFNDSSVSAVSLTKIFSSFGGHSGGWICSNTNAYMLMYRRLEPERNENFVHTDQLPKHLVDLRNKLTRHQMACERARQLYHLEWKKRSTPFTLQFLVPSEVIKFLYKLVTGCVRLSLFCLYFIRDEFTRTGLDTPDLNVMPKPLPQQQHHHQLPIFEPVKWTPEFAACKGLDELCEVPEWTSSAQRRLFTKNMLKKDLENRSESPPPPPVYLNLSADKIGEVVKGTAEADAAKMTASLSPSPSVALAMENFCYTLPSESDSEDADGGEGKAAAFVSGDGADDDDGDGDEEAGRGDGDARAEAGSDDSGGDVSGATDASNMLGTAAARAAKQLHNDAEDEENNVRMEIDDNDDDRMNVSGYNSLSISPKVSENNDEDEVEEVPEIQMNGMHSDDVTGERVVELSVFPWVKMGDFVGWLKRYLGMNESTDCFELYWQSASESNPEKNDSDILCRYQDDNKVAEHFCDASRFTVKLTKRTQTPQHPPSQSGFRCMTITK